MSKRVAIITFQNAVNHGAVLQAFALQSFLSKENLVSILDYRCPSIDLAYYPKKSRVQKLKGFIKKFVFPKYSHQVSLKMKRFSSFKQKYLLLTKTYNSTTISNANKDFEVFITGSDQVWNPEITGFDSAYFLNFVDKKTKISYAASFGSDELDYKSKLFIKEHLSNFDNISLREESGITLLNEITGEQTQTLVCDPVFLLSPEEWMSSLAISKKETKKYVLVYCVQNPTYCIKFAVDYAKKKHLKVVYLNHDGTRKKQKGCLNNYDSGPREFLSFLLNAECVITTSFHAIAFSLIFNVPFFYELSLNKVNKNTRIIGLSEYFGFQHRMIASPQYDGSVLEINWSKVNESIVSLKNESVEFLRKCQLIN